MGSNNANAFFPQKNNKIFNLLPIKVFSNFLLWQNISNIQFYIYNKHLSPRSWLHFPPPARSVYNSHPSECEMISHGLSCISLMIVTLTIFICVANLHSYSCPLLILNGVLFLFLHCRSSLYILDINLLSEYDLQIFSQILCVDFALCCCVRWCIQALLLA